MTPLTARRAAVALLAALAWSAMAAPSSDKPQDYAYTAALTTVASQGVLQLRLPQDVYLHARSQELNDVRVFDATGTALPFALRHPSTERQTSHRSLPLKIFPLMTGREQNDGPVALDVRTGTDGQLLSVQLRPDRPHGANSVQRLSALILDLGPVGDNPPQIDALRFTPPSSQQEYSAQILLDTSDDLQQWDSAGTAELNWLSNRQAQTLANDRLNFPPRRFRYARVSWRRGTPLLFAGISAEQLLHTDSPPDTDTLLLLPEPGKYPGDLMYTAPLAVPVRKVGLQFNEASTALTATVGVYRELPAPQLGKSTTWRFDPVLSATFYRIAQDGAERSSGDLEIAPRHAVQWALRTQGESAARPALRIGWEPASVIFLASGKAPYTLAVGRAQAAPAARDIAQVAPGFSDQELRTLETATAGPLRLRRDNAAENERSAREAGAAARQRILILWGLLLAGVSVLAFMVWRLLKQQSTNARY